MPEAVVKVGPESLGRLERVDLRTVWENEASDFTPWLARQENLRLLAEAIDIELELEECEAHVGDFRADIVCREQTEKVRVIIENQLGRTDHSHLGQLMTYAAGLDAVTIVWLAHRFTEEHRAAVDWLNKVTREGINLFGLEIELWKIGDSQIAPKFNVVCKPNDWLKASAEVRSELTGTKALQLEFWTAFREFVQARATPISAQRPRAQNWMPISIGSATYRLYAVASTWNTEEGNYGSHELRAEFMMDGENADLQFLSLLAEREAIEREFGEPLLWHRPEDKHARKIFLRRGFSLDNSSEWPVGHAWLLEKLEKLRAVFVPWMQRINSGALVLGTQPPD